MQHGQRGWRANGAWLFGLAVLPALHAQSQPVPQDVISNEALTSVAVLEALDPTAVRARSLRIGATGRSAPPRASASLLITFDTNSSELRGAARRQLDVVASALRNEASAYGRRVVPASVVTRPRPARRKSATPSSASSRRTCSDTDDIKPDST